MNLAKLADMASKLDSQTRIIATGYIAQRDGHGSPHEQLPEKHIHKHVWWSTGEGFDLCIRCEATTRTPRLNPWKQETA
jgi:hypothetical protein